MPLTEREYQVEGLGRHWQELELLLGVKKADDFIDKMLAVLAGDGLLTGEKNEIKQEARRYKEMLPSSII